MTAWVTALKYDANQIYIAAMYGQAENMTPYGQNQIADETNNIEVIVQYQFLNGLRPSLGFVSQRGKNLLAYSNFKGGDETIQRYIAVGGYYYLKKILVTYADYRINLLKDNEFTEASGITTKDGIALGMIYQF